MRLNQRVAGEGDRWGTLAPERRVLAVVRTVTSASRLLDVLPVFDGDTRVQVFFTVNEGSAFGAEVPAFLHGLRVRLLPWREAVRTRFDLALSASANGGLHRLKAPVVVMPHGVGHNRLVEAATGRPDVASGLAGGQLLHRGRVVPAAIVLSHGEQLERLRRTCPPAAEVALVAGDPSFDRMVDSLPMRDRYREALGVRDGRRLLVLTSTWGPDSLFGRRPHLLARWVAELPVDRYRAALILHPNVWARHGPFQIEGWLAEALSAGLMLIPPEEGWRAALVAADRVVGDHGSVTYYAAALGRPTLLAAFGEAELDPDSPLAAFGRAQPRLDPARGLLEQLEDLTAPAAVPDALAMRGLAASNLRTALYGLMGLEQPPVPPRSRPVPAPVPRGRGVPALLVEGTARPDLVEMERYPAVLDDGDRLADPHLVVDEREADRRLLESAAIFVRRACSSEAGTGGGTEAGAWAEADEWAGSVFARYPGSELAAAALPAGRCLIALRGGRRVHARGADVGLCASALYLRHLAGLPLDGAMTVKAGASEVRIHATPPRSF